MKVQIVKDPSWQWRVTSFSTSEVQQRDDLSDFSPVGCTALTVVNSGCSKKMEGSITVELRR